ncbi:hypothetical protein NFI99_12135 (plasmid) [Burkholderia glumae]|uniref:Uncharacterized protein n=1 Tax=Burkholderia glumae TaxID=337 RepID=A0ABY5BCE4_BURGL|nr:hypothetical protein [Burkholderia glumae]USS44203.1 hypothetical protein NFI99_12135 [Burkholderia glumae]
MKEGYVVAMHSKRSSHDHECRVTTLRQTSRAIRLVLEDDALDDSERAALKAAIFIVDKLAGTHRRAATIRRDDEDLSPVSETALRESAQASGTDETGAVPERVEKGTH